MVSHAPVANLHADPVKEMEKRVKAVCEKVSSYPVFVTGAWGCGFFGNKLENVEGWFKKYATNNEVVMAIKPR